MNKPSSQKSKPTTIRLAESVYQQIFHSIGSQHAEQGGIFGGNREQNVITDFVFDGSARRSRATYSPDHESLNHLLANKWNPNGVSFCGFAHSHPPGCRQPSSGDLAYAERIFAANPELSTFFLPIVMTTPDTGKFELLPYVVQRDGKGVRLETAKVELIPAARTKRKDARKNRDNQLAIAVPSDRQEIFERVQDAYSLEVLAQCHLICVGTGGAALFIEEMARAGGGRFTLIDPDTVSVTNIATQQMYQRDIGKPKVERVAARIRAINPAAQITTQQQYLDEITDEEFARICQPQEKTNGKGITILCGLTDDFSTQARINRLGLNFGLPTLNAQVYREGRGAEITFTYPGVTPACHRCILSSRYAYYLNQGFQNDVTSHGTPIFSTTRLNSHKGNIAMAMLHHGTNHPRWGNLLSRIGNRNLIQIRLDPDLATTLQLKIFDQVFANAEREKIFFDETVWLPQQPDCPANGFPYCPECQGTGDLRDAIGTFTDTRNMPL